MATVAKINEHSEFPDRPRRGSRYNPLVVECVLALHLPAWTAEGDPGPTRQYHFKATGTLSSVTKKNPKVFSADVWEAYPPLPEYVNADDKQGRPYQSKLLAALRTALAQAVGYAASFNWRSRGTSQRKGRSKVMAEQVNEARTRPDVCHIEVVSLLPSSPDAPYTFWCGEQLDLATHLEEGAEDMEICPDCLAAESIAYAVLQSMRLGAPVADILALMLEGEKARMRLQKGENINGDGD